MIGETSYVAASPKIIELKFRYRPYLTIAGCVLVRSMMNNVTLGRA
jgi:hypothetical protein